MSAVLPNVHSCSGCHLCLSLYILTKRFSCVCVRACFVFCMCISDVLFVPAGWAHGILNLREGLGLAEEFDLVQW